MHENLQDDVSDSDSGDEVDQRRLQLYERSRLRYYYAVVECQDVRTAAHLYAECDGIEFLRSACKLDMRFVPEDQVGLLSNGPAVPVKSHIRNMKVLAEGQGSLWTQHRHMRPCIIGIMPFVDAC